MSGDHFQNQLNWIAGLSGEDKVRAASVMAWQSAATTLNELVKQFNTITFGSEHRELNRYREVQLKKMIIGMLYEMDACLNYWARILHENGLLDQQIKDHKREFKTACKKVGLGVLKQIRNGVAFHFTEYLADPNAIVDTYKAVDQISLGSINEILQAAILCGFAMRQKVLDCIK